MRKGLSLSPERELALVPRRLSLVGNVLLDPFLGAAGTDAAEVEAIGPKLPSP